MACYSSAHGVPAFTSQCARSHTIAHCAWLLSGRFPDLSTSWQHTRDEIWNDIFTNFSSDERQPFVQSKVRFR